MGILQKFGYFIKKFLIWEMKLGLETQHLPISNIDNKYLYLLKTKSKCVFLWCDCTKTLHHWKRGYNHFLFFTRTLQAFVTVDNPSWPTQPI